MSVVTFLIGNGFDLACGLKSRYSDTYEGYINSRSSSKAIEFFKTNIGKDIDKWSDFEMALAEHAKNFQNEHDLIECIRDYKVYLRTYLEQQQKNFYDSCDGKIDPYILNEGTVRLLTLSSTDMTENDHNAVFSVLNKGPKMIYKFVNFNFTDVFDNLEKEAIQYMNRRDCDINEIIHIHGKLDSLVLGVDNENQLTGLSSYELKRDGKLAIIKPVLVEQCDTSRRTNALADIKSSDVICAFGLSLGESDLTWKNAVSDWLLQDVKHHLVFYRYSSETGKIDITQRFEDEHNTKKSLIKTLYGDSLEKNDNEKYNQLFEQIHSPRSQSILDLSKSSRNFNDGIIKRL